MRSSGIMPVLLPCPCSLGDDRTVGSRPRRGNEPAEADGRGRAAGCIIGAMSTAQGGIFSLGTASHAYLEFDRRREPDGAALVPAIASLREPRTTMGGVNLVVGFRPELWVEVAPEDA